MLVCRESLWGWLHPPPRMTQQYHLASMAARLSSTGNAPQQSPPSPLLDQSLHSQQQPSPWDRSRLPKVQLPVPLRGTRLPVWGTYGCGKDCLILIPFRLPHISCFTLILKCFSSDSDRCPDVGIGPLLHFPHLQRAGPVLLRLLFFPSSFILPSFAWFYMSFSSGQVLLSALSWYSACTSVSEGVFLMYPWREMYSTSTYSSAILFSSQLIFCKHLSYYYFTTEP